MTISVFPKVTIVMPVYNEARFIGQTLNQLLDQDYPKHLLEILVIDGMSEDNTQEIIRKIVSENECINLLLNPKRRSSAGRNIGFKQGSGAYFVVIDGHCYIPNNQLVKNVVIAFQKSGADCLGRPQQLDPPGLTNFQKAVAAARAAKIGHSGASFIYSDFEGFISPQSNGAAYRKDVFEKVGFVDENFDAAEDLEFNYRAEKAGLKCYTGPELMVKYYPRESLGALFRQLSRYGRGRMRFVKKHPNAITMNQLIPCFFVLGLATIVPALLTLIFQGCLILLSILFVIPYVIYVGLICFFSIYTAYKNTWKFLVILPWIFLVIHFSLGWGGLRELFLVLFSAVRRSHSKV